MAKLNGKRIAVPRLCSEVHIIVCLHNDEGGAVVAVYSDLDKAERELKKLLKQFGPHSYEIDSRELED